MLEKLAERFGAAPTIACVIVFGILLSLVVILLMSKLEYFLKRIWRSEITVGARSIRLCSVPLTGLVAVSPAAAFFLSKSGYPDLFIFLSLLLPIALTIIWSVFTCGMRGVWVWVVLILLGIFIFFAVATGIFFIIGAGAIFLAILGGSRTDLVQIQRGSDILTLEPAGGVYYRDVSTGERFWKDSSYMVDSNEHRYRII